MHFVICYAARMQATNDEVIDDNSLVDRITMKKQTSKAHPKAKDIESLDKFEDHNIMQEREG